MTDDELALRAVTFIDSLEAVPPGEAATVLVLALAHVLHRRTDGSSNDEAADAVRKALSGRLARLDAARGRGVS